MCIRDRVVAERSVPVLQRGHQPRQLPEGEQLDVVGEGDELRPEALLEVAGLPDDLGQSAWLSHPEPTDRPFVLVLVAFDDAKGVPQPQLAPFAHLGMELPSRADVDAMAEQARADHCLTWEPVQLPPPVGYVCAATDPDGNVVEFSFDQGVAAKVIEAFGEV